MSLTHLIRKTVFALSATGLMAWSTASQAQPSTNFVKRLSDLEAAVAQMSLALAELRASNNTLTAQVQAIGTQANGMDGKITTLQTGLTQAAATAKSYTDTAAARTLADAKTYSDNRLAPVSDKLVHVVRSGNNLIINGANLHVRNGLGSTANNGVNGLGNLIVGYNESRNQAPANPDVRTGSHNLVVGIGANFSRTSSIITGVNNTSGGNYASVYAGTGNTATGTFSAVMGGFNNLTSGGWATILGGRDRTAANQLDHLP